jgi:serine/threonine-protein kinase
MSSPNKPNPRSDTTSSAPKPARLSPGQVVGEYVVKGLLAEGGMASVYSAMHPLIAKRAALKVMNPRFSHDAKAAAQLLQEARAINEIGHPNIVDVFSCGQLEDGRSYLVMEWLEGETLGQRLWRERISFQESCEIILQICDALEAAHAHRIVHLDIKPDNVFLVTPRHGRPLVKLLDFGIARMLRGGRQAAGARSVAGTPHYLSPEQAQASPTLDHRSDVYSLGVLAYEMFTGRTPFEAQKAEDLLAQHVRAMPPPPDVEWTGVGTDLALLLLEMLFKVPSRRPTLRELRERLTALRERSAMANTQRFAAIVRRPARKSRWLALSAPAVAAMLLIAWKLEAGSRTIARTRGASPPAMAASLPTVHEPAAPDVLAPDPHVAQPRRRYHRKHAVEIAASSERGDTPALLGGNDYLIDSAGVRRR